MTYEEIEAVVKRTLSEKRYRHCCEVAKRAVELAKIYEQDQEKARLIGMVHDIAKEMPQEEAIAYAEKNGIVFDDIEKAEPGLWHSKIGADIAKKQFGFTEDMAKSICYHTTGNCHMSIMDKIIYLADKTEASRSFIDLEKAKNISNQDLDEGMLYVAKIAIEYSLAKQSLIHPDTIYVINQILKHKKNKIVK